MPSDRRFDRYDKLRNVDSVRWAAPVPDRCRVRTCVRRLPHGLVLGHTRAPQPRREGGAFMSMDASARNAPRLPRALLVSSFVLPRSGGIEQFVDIAARLLRGHGWRVRILACRPRGVEAEADATIPTHYLGRSGWPLPIGGLRTLWREVGNADVVVANGTRHLLPNVAALAARLRGKRVVFVLHGSGASFSTSSFLYHRVLGSLFERLLSRPALRRSRPVSLSRAGVVGCRTRYGVEATYVPFPLRELPPPTPTPLGSGEPLKIVWAGRLYGEKNPLAAVAAVDRVRQQRPATLDVYGSGPLLAEFEELARDRPWLTVRGPRSWAEIQQVQGAAHVCLSTSLRDATQMAVLEPLARGVPGSRWYQPESGTRSATTRAAGGRSASSRAIPRPRRKRFSRSRPPTAAIASASPRTRTSCSGDTAKARAASRSCSSPRPLQPATAWLLPAKRNFQ